MCECCCKDRQEKQQPDIESDEMLEVGLLKIPKALYLAIGVMNGRYGTGQERKDLLGTDYTATQEAVNIIAPMWEEK